MGIGHEYRSMSAVAAAFGLALALPLACQPKPPPGPGAVVQATAGSGGMSTTPQNACEMAYGSVCGSPCSGDAACGMGLHCADAKCTADCIDSSECGSGRCTADGRCDQIMLDPMQTDPDAGVGTKERPHCIEGQVEFTAVMPQVWLLLDRSGSMTELFGATSRWTALGSVLLGDPTNPSDRGVVGDFEQRVAFGAVFYTTGAATTGCVLDLESVALAANNYAHIRQRYNKLSPTGGTPTADAIAATVAVAATSDLTGGPKILVLATDGVPGSCSPRTGTATQEVENEVDKAFHKNVKTFAISIAAGTDAQHMQRVANLGVGLPADSTTPAALYSADSQQALKDAFGSILKDVPRSCVFSLNGDVDRDHADKGSVTLAGQKLGYGDENGWVLKQTDQVEIVGSACQRIQDGEEDLDISFPCSVFTPVVK